MSSRVLEIVSYLIGRRGGLAIGRVNLGVRSVRVSFFLHGDADK